MGGALVTPLAQAAADRNHGREQGLVAATLLPITAVAILALCIALPLLWLMPLGTLFGLAATTTAAQPLRIAVLIACVGTIGAVPLSVIDSARQAYQETHISNLFGLCQTRFCARDSVDGLVGAYIACVCCGDSAFAAGGSVIEFGAAVRAPAVPVRAAPWLRIVAFSPSLGGGWFQLYGSRGYRQCSHLPVAGLLHGSGSAAAGKFDFRCVLATYSTGIVFGRELGTAALACRCRRPSRADYAWVIRTVQRARAAALAYGACGLLAFGFMMNLILRLWLHRPIHVSPAICWLAGTYILLAAWEYVYWPLALGLGAMRPASHLVFLRAAIPAAFVPLAARFGQVGVMVLLCSSVIFVTAWIYPLLLTPYSLAFHRNIA